MRFSYSIAWLLSALALPLATHAASVDLVVDDVKIYPLHAFFSNERDQEVAPIASDRVVLYAPVRNVGSDSVTESFDVLWRIDGQEVAVTRHDREILPGTTSTQDFQLAIDWTFPSNKTYVVQVTIDTGEEVAETNEQNNFVSENIVVRSAFQDTTAVPFTIEVDDSSDGDSSNPLSGYYFPDTGSSSLEADAAAYLRKEGIIEGIDGLFAGSKGVNRAEMTIFLLKSRYGSVASVPYTATFTDISDGKWYTAPIIDAVAKGIIFGYDDGTFRYRDPVTRGQFLAMLARTFNLQRNLPYSYTDVQSGKWYAEYAGIAEKYDLFPGDTGDRLYQSSPMSRGEVAVAMYQYLQSGLL